MSKLAPVLERYKYILGVGAPKADDVLGALMHMYLTHGESWVSFRDLDYARDTLTGLLETKIEEGVHLKQRLSKEALEILREEGLIP